MSGKLTAEQVREAIEANSWAETSTIREFNDSSWQAIADELNNRAERTCKPYGEWERVSQTQEIRHIYCDCGEYLGMDRRNSLPFEIEYKADMPNYCPNCGCKVVVE